MTRLTLNAKLENKENKALQAKPKKLTLNTKLENKKIKLWKPTKKLTLNAKIEGPQVKTYGGDTIKMPIDVNLWW